MNDKDDGLNCFRGMVSALWMQLALIAIVLLIWFGYKAIHSCECEDEYDTMNPRVHSNEYQIKRNP
jgi:hypothetical protein